MHIVTVVMGAKIAMSHIVDVLTGHVFKRFKANNNVQFILVTFGLPLVHL